ncbi:FISUMP domain-containing protein [Flavihumibacter solisilvae]|uniref:FISUMP domain-containing protein n=1 Tax=Flavihumibacter solisilvae TaxID=1349421 RepID=UPI000691993B|nr:FISUMP domain-containing protein [Flavihumibacter solisilvae]
MLTRIIFSFVLTISCSLNNLAMSQTKNADRLKDTVLADSDKNRYAVKVMKDGNLWMTDNLKLNTAGSYCFGDSVENCKKYGRLYTFEAAQNVCSRLGEGWRLPANVDWQKLTWAYAGEAIDTVAVRKMAFQSLKENGSAHFNAVLGGGRDLEGKYARLEAHGFYWSSTSTDDSNAWFANFAKGSQALYVQKDGEKGDAFAVRCVKNMGQSK